MPDIDADYISDKHAFASSLFEDANTNAREVERLFKGEYQAGEDQANASNPASPRAFKPARPRAIVEKYLTLLSVRASQSISIPPRTADEDEQVRTTRVEEWLNAYAEAYRREVKRDIRRRATYWYLLRGRACFEVRFDPSYLGRDKLPLRQYADDPLSIFPVWGVDGIGYYTKQTSRYAWEIAKWSADQEKWQAVKLPDDENDPITLVEYWDDNYCGATVDGELLYVNEHKYGFVPLAEAHCMDTPLDDAAWAYQSVLEPILDTLKQTFSLVSKMGAGVDMFYWPTILVQFDDNTLQAYDGGTIRAADIPKLGVKQIQVINPQPNAGVLQQLLGWLNGDAQVGGIPDIAWGAEPTSLQSGFAVSQVLNQIMDKIQDKKVNLELALGWHYGHLLRLVEQFGGASGAWLNVPRAEGKANAYAGQRLPDY